ncbi:hypothetical protein K7472_14380 [Streptomyces sp. PTM05]|uniref:Uncharacterized protein n=1 Tax=Streptantibioticus parmotrematis TaxID=2873249 RepID=A0ABS7QUI3_9ACTN|nr:hypothetical protein [Streptantibioticus parmotrematis]MBY8886035.1 hypothetical protein [Streptantibioticus parmotrematis]
MIHDLTELGQVGRVLNEALALLEGERKRLQRLYGEPAQDEHHIAGSPVQTLYGIAQLADGVRDQLKRVALAAGYVTFGLDERADQAVRVARFEPVGFPSGVDRMARPLGEATVRALELIRDVADFFDGDMAIEIDVCLAAPEATYPPRDWDAYQQQRLNRPE